MDSNGEGVCGMKKKLRGKRGSPMAGFVRGETRARVSTSFTQGGDSESPESHSRRFRQRERERERESERENY